MHAGGPTSKKGPKKNGKNCRRAQTARGGNSGGKLVAELHRRLFERKRSIESGVKKSAREDERKPGDFREAFQAGLGGGQESGAKKKKVLEKCPTENLGMLLLKKFVTLRYEYRVEKTSTGGVDVDDHVFARFANATRKTSGVAKAKKRKGQNKQVLPGPANEG